MGILIDFNDAKRKLEEKKKQRASIVDAIELEDLDNINDFFLHSIINEILNNTESGEDK